MQRIFLLLLLSLSLAGGAAAQWNTGSMFRMGQNAIYFDDYVTAIENFNNIIRLKPYLSEPYFFRGVAKLSLDDYEGAVQDFDGALSLNPNYFQAYMYRGVALNALGRYDEALLCYGKAVALDPTVAYVYANRGMTYAETGRLEEAEADYTKALRLDPELLPAYLNRAVVREKRDNVDGAMADCNTAIGLNFFSDDALGLRGYLFYRRKDYHNAIEDFNRALKANPGNKRILMSRAMVWYEMKKYRETLADYDRVVALDSNYIFAYYNRALLRAEIGETNAAISDLDKVVDRNPDNILIYFNRGLLKMEILDWYGAYDDFTESIRLYPDFVKAYMARSVASTRLQDEASAEKDSRKALEIMDRYRRMKAGDRNALVDTTADFQRLVDVNAREDEIRDVINGRVQDRNVIVRLQKVFYVQYMSLDSLRSGKVQYYNRHVMQYNQSHNYEPAVTVCNRSQQYPGHFAADEAARLTERIRKGGSRDDFFLRGCFRMCLEEYPKAIADFDAVLEDGKEDILALFNRANARMMMYDYIESVDDHSPQVVGEKRQENRKTDYSLVMEDYRKCLKADPDFVFAIFNMANVHAKNGEIDRAIAGYTQVIRKDKDIAEAYFNRGLLYIYIGQKALANADLGKAGELGIVEAYNIIKRYCKGGVR